MSGYVAEIDAHKILEHLGESEAVVAITSFHGGPVVKNRPFGWIDVGAATVRQGSAEHAAKDVARMVDISGTREITQSVEYGIVALVDTAIMALSPAVNDPNSAVEAIETMSFLFARMSDTPLGTYAVPDDTSRPHIVIAWRTFGQYVELATSQIVDYGVTDRYVLQALRRFAESLSTLDLDDNDRRYVDEFAARLDVAPVH